MKIALLYLYCMIGAVVGQSIIKSPTDTTGIIGETAKFVCEVDYGEHIPAMNWKFNNIIIYSFMDDKVGYPFGTNKYVVTNYKNIFTLDVKNLNYKDGGNYICEVINQQNSAALIVLGSPAIIQETTNLIEGETAIFTCKAKFGGPSSDKISYDNFSQIQLVLDDDTYQETSHSQNEFLIRKVYEILVNESMHAKDLKCEIGTLKSEHLMSSITLNVQYSVRNITYTPQEYNYEFGDNINCSARGNPDPIFEWRNLKDAENVMKGQVLNIADDMVGKNSWTCTARNSVGGIIYEDKVTAIFYAVYKIFRTLPEDNDVKPVLFLIAFGCIGAGILCLIAYKRFRGVIIKFQRSSATPSLYVTTAATVFGSSFQHGWNTGVLNIPQAFIKKFIYESFMEHNGFKPSSNQLEMLWAVCVSIYLLSGFLGVLVAGKLADKLGRKYALQICHILSIIAAILFGLCKMAHSFEMLLFGRFIIGFGCGAGSRLVIMYLSEIAPDDIQNEVLMAHRFGLTFGILLSQIAGLPHCLGNESSWPYLLSLAALPCVTSFLILFCFPQSPVDHLMKFKRAQEQEKGKELVMADSQKSHQVDDPHCVNAGPEKNGENVEDEIDSNPQEAKLVGDVEKDENNKHYNNAKKAFETFQTNENFKNYYRIFETTRKVTVRQLFQPDYINLSPCLILMCCLNICQQLSGINILFYYSLNVFESSGVPQGIIGYCVVSTGVTDVVMSGVSIVGHFKHRNLLLIGELIMIISSLMIMLAYHLQVFYITIVSVITFVWGFALGFGSITTYVGKELFFPGPRIPAVTIARSCNWLANFSVALVYPVLHLKAGPYSIWIFTSFLLVFIVYFFIKLPETKDSSREDIYKELKIEINPSWFIGDETRQPEEIPLQEIEDKQHNATSLPTTDTDSNANTKANS